MPINASTHFDLHLGHQYLSVESNRQGKNYIEILTLKGTEIYCNVIVRNYEINDNILLIFLWSKV